MWLVRCSDAVAEIMPKDEEQKRSKNSPEGKLGDHDYQFFVHNPTKLDYQFTVPQNNPASSGGASTGKTTSYLASAPLPATPIMKSAASPAAKTSPSASSVTPEIAPPGSTDRHIADRNGAVIVYSLWQLLPSSVTYPN